MFFVIDNQTRSVASMIEAAQIAGKLRKRERQYIFIEYFKKEILSKI